MAVVKSDSDAPPGPPPAYSNIPSISTIPSQQTNRSYSDSPYSMPIPEPYTQPHPGYGPTPIVQQEGVLPYYDPRSPYSLELAVTRARWRFFWAMVWAFGIWFALGLVTSGIVIDIEYPDNTVAVEQLGAQDWIIPSPQ